MDEWMGSWMDGKQGRPREEGGLPPKELDLRIRVKKREGKFACDLHVNCVNSRPRALESPWLLLPLWWFSHLLVGKPPGSQLCGHSWRRWVRKLTTDFPKTKQISLGSSWF